jgi:hypothetical protein
VLRVSDSALISVIFQLDFEIVRTIVLYVSLYYRNSTLWGFEGDGQEMFYWGNEIFKERHISKHDLYFYISPTNVKRNIKIVLLL